MAHGFTVLEVSVALMVIAILSVILLGVISSLRARAQRAQCVANLRSLYIATDSFVQQNGSWPQIPRDDSGISPQYAEAWVKTLEPFSIERKTWICPTIQNLMNNPDYSKAETARMDYIPMPFDDKPTTPHQWPRQPWFIESGSVHGNGNLIIFTDGSINDLTTVLQSAIRK
jgi:prepilin-type N-terminal cleavage/methylation domain-containing protein